MKLLLHFIFFLVFCLGFSQTNLTPEMIVQKQLEAYNNKNLNEFAKYYTDDIELYNFPNQLDTKGIDKFRDTYDNFFKSVPDLKCEILKRIVQGNIVIDHEKVTTSIAAEPMFAIAIYEIKDNKIHKVWFISKTEN